MVKRYFFKYFFYSLLTILYSGLYASQKSITIFEGNENPTKKVISINSKNTYPTSLHFLLTTIGRQSIFRMIKSLEKQLKPQDFLTIVFDNKDKESVFEGVKLKLAQLPCNAEVIWEEKNLGYWGHAIRNKYKRLPGDFILHCDDDDMYLPGSLDTIRAVCQDKSKLYFFRLRSAGSSIWRDPHVRIGNMGTPCGVIPRAYNSLSRWGYFYGGDGAFYMKLVRKIGNHNVIFVDSLIYFVKGAGNGRKYLI
ncbi:glycosyltransferase family 2 protein [Candidatus Dependentiae bacterium]|nr:glycosyltransferase family 2 protein [Candidatus Dependentiae bacterium]